MAKFSTLQRSTSAPHHQFTGESVEMICFCFVLNKFVKVIFFISNKDAALVS